MSNGSERQEIGVKRKKVKRIVRKIWKVIEIENERLR